VFVGLDIRSDSILAVRLNEDGTVAARAVRRMSPRTVPRIVAAALGEDAAAAIGAARAAMLQP
jgi:hypothetical protein